MADQKFPLDAGDPTRGEVPVVFNEEEDDELYSQDGGDQEVNNATARAEDRSAEQQLIESARGFFGLNGAVDGAGTATQQQQSKDGLPALMLRSLISTPFYPIKLVQVLIQLGYEPTAPERRYSFVFRQYLYYYPGIFGYAKHIVRQEGWAALYRGVCLSVFSQLVTLSAHYVIHPVVTSMVTQLPLSVVSTGNGDVPDTEPQNVETLRGVLVQATRSFMTSLLTSVSVEIVIHPFHVIVVRSIAQHVGKETVYNTLWSSLTQIYNEEGLSGFYAGLVPALLGHTSSCLIYSSMWIFFQLLAINAPYNWIKMFIQGIVAVPLLAYIPRTYSYPFSLMSNVMAVSGTRLMVAKQPAYTGWMDCYRDLKSTGSLYRGSVMLFPRFAYKVPPLQ